MLKVTMQFTKEELKILEESLEDEIQYWKGPDYTCQNILDNVRRKLQIIIEKETAIKRLPDITPRDPESR